MRTPPTPSHEEFIVVLVKDTPWADSRTLAEITSIWGQAVGYMHADGQEGRPWHYARDQLKREVLELVANEQSTLSPAARRLINRHS